MPLAESDYDLKPAPAFPLIDTFEERRGMRVPKRYAPPPAHWRGMPADRL